MSSFSSKNRQKSIKKYNKTQYDLIVIGGGATGTGIALDAASRGLKTLLLEKDDFASGTSSKSTKLIHGGLRYLKQLDVALVRESGTERAVVNRIAPHLCLPEKMLLPLIKNGTFGKYSTSVGLWVYDFLAGVEAKDKRKMLSKKQALAKERLLNEKTLVGAGYYAEYRTDDARLTIELAKKANEFGANLLNYCEVTGFSYDGDQINGVQCMDELTGNKIQFSAKIVVSAGGPWVDTLREKNNSLNNKRLFLSKGVHIVVPRGRLPLQQSIYFDVPDGRMIFAIPRGKATYVGTTDTAYTGSLNRVVATEEDLQYLLKAVNHMFPSITLTKYDVISNWAGLRPLIREEGKSPSEMSRKDEIFEANDGLISIAGGKLTGYRKMAERIVDKALKILSENSDRSFVPTKTKTISLGDVAIKSNEEVLQLVSNYESKCLELGLDPYYGWYLVTTYGQAASNIVARINKDPKDPSKSLLMAELGYCLEHELIQKADDFCVRRTGRLYFDIQSIKDYYPEIIAQMAVVLDWDEVRQDAETKHLELLIQDASTYYESEQVPELSYS